jgi:hypothetical protein
MLLLPTTDVGLICRWFCVGVATAAIVVIASAAVAFVAGFVTISYVATDVVVVVVVVVVASLCCICPT